MKKHRLNLFGKAGLYKYTIPLFVKIEVDFEFKTIEYSLQRFYHEIT
jgi:hypothetical protein